MQPILKTIKRSPLDKKRRLFIPYTVYPVFAWLALFIIAGLEIYYLNRYGDTGTLYPIGGFCTLFYGTLMILTFFKRRQNISRLVIFSRNQGGMIEEGLLLDDEGIKNFVNGYFSQRLAWTALSGYRNRKRHIEINIAGIGFFLPKHNFSLDELNCIYDLIASKLSDPHKRFFDSERSISPPPFPKSRETKQAQSGRREILTPAPHTTGHTDP